MKKFYLFLLASILILTPLFVFAASSDDLVIASDEIVNGNLIKSAESLKIEGVVNGDVIFTGSDLEITGTIAGDVFALTNTAVITGNIQGSVRILAGGSIELSGKVDRNVNVLSKNINIDEMAEINWDLVAVGATVENRGTVGGNLSVTGSEIVLTNKIGKNADLYLGTSGKATISATVQIAGDLTYRSSNDNQIDIVEGAEIFGQTNHNVISLFKPRKETIDSLYFLGKLISIFGLIVVGLVLITLVPQIVTQISTEMNKSPGRSMLWGVAFLILTPLIAFVLLITVIGIPLAIIMFILYLIAFYIAYLLAGITLGLTIVKKLSKRKSRRGLFWPMIIGLIVLDLICSIPIVGWILCVLMIVWAIGALIEIIISILANYR